LKKLEERAEQGNTTQQHVEEMTNLFSTWAEQHRLDLGQGSQQ
jgi:hypothetical protein